MIFTYYRLLNQHKHSDEPVIDISIWTHAYQWYSEKQHKIIRYLDKYWFDTANDADINLLCEANANDINAQTTTIEESSNSQAAVESKESDDIIITSYIGPSSKGPGKG